VWQNFDGDGAVQPRVGRAEDLSHSTAPRAVNFTKNLNANIERLKLDVVTIAPLHGFVVPVIELKKLAGAT
jgi:hypothetical protein